MAKNKLNTIDSNKSLEVELGKINDEDIQDMLNEILNSRNIEKNKVSRELFNHIITTLKKEGNTAKYDNELINKASRIKNLETHQSMLEAIHYDQQGFALELIKCLITEYQCKTPSEISLAQLATMSYTRYLRLSTEINLNCTPPDWLSNEYNQFLNMKIKDLDRSFRQYTTAIQLLEQKKTPSIKVNIRTNNAFIAENQQLNEYNKENNESK